MQYINDMNIFIPSSGYKFQLRNMGLVGGLQSGSN